MGADNDSSKEQTKKTEAVNKIEDDQSNDTTPSSSSSSFKTFTLDDLCELVKAIKFAYPDYGMRRVLREIVEVASVKGQGEPELKEVKLSDIKKIWKKLGLSSTEAAAPATSPSKTPQSSVANTPSDPDSSTTLKFYTVGENEASRGNDEEYSNVVTLAKGYQTAAEALLAEQASNEKGGGKNDDALDSGKWFHFYLNVPADLSGKKPYQALINFSDANATSSSDKSSTKVKGKGAKKAKGKSKSSRLTYSEQIVKIQVAAPLDNNEMSIKTPMLLYNQDRSARTFIHPSSDTNIEKEEDGYTCINEIIASGGSTGVLGNRGGTKGYFQTKIYAKKGIISVDASSLVLKQTW